MTEVNTYHLDNGYFTKRDTNGSRLAVEVTKTGFAHEASRSSGLLRVPSLVHSTEFVMVTSAIVDSRRLRDVLAGGGEQQELVRRAARALAEIHAWSPQGLGGTCLPQRGGPSAREVFIHGDYTLDNILVTTTPTTLWVVDWSTPPWLGSWATTGDARWDVAMFAMNLFLQRPGDPRWLATSTSIAKQFVREYSAASGNPLTGLKKFYLEALMTYARARPTAGTASRIPSAVRGAVYLP